MRSLWNLVSFPPVWNYISVREKALGGGDGERSMQDSTELVCIAGLGAEGADAVEAHGGRPGRICRKASRKGRGRILLCLSPFSVRGSFGF